MRISDKDRRTLIDQLKKVKDPRERDRIIWTLAGQEQTALPEDGPRVSPLLSLPDRTKTQRSVPQQASQRKEAPMISFHLQRLLGLIVPAFFIIFGLMRIGQALLNYMQSEQIEPEISNLLTGGIFLAFGLVGIFRAMRPEPAKPEETP
jgi:hypothetical protein